MHMQSPFNNMPSSMESSYLAPENCLDIRVALWILSGQPFSVMQ